MKESRFDGKVAIVTGAGGGLGREYALLLAARGAKVVVNDAGTDVSGAGTSAAPAQAVVRAITDAGGDAVADTHSVTSPSHGAAIVQTALDHFGRVDILINNAGNAVHARFADLTPEDLEAIIDVNLRGTFFVTQPAWRAMLAQHYGRVLNTFSGNIFGFPRSAAASAAKAGIVGLTRALAYEGAEHGICVNALAPLAFTRLSREVPDESFREWMAAACPARLVAPVAAWLVHEACTANGELFTAGAGRVAKVFLGVTRGHTTQELTIEDVRDHFEAVREETAYFVPETAVDELAHFRLLH